MAKTRGSSAFRTAQPLRAGDVRDDGLDLGELVEGVDALEAEVVGGDVGDDGDVVAGQPDALEEDAAAGGLGDGDLDSCGGQDASGAARAGVVAGLDQLAVDVDAVGVGPAHVLAPGTGDVGDHPARRGLPVGPRDRDDRDLRDDRGRPGAVLGVGHVLGRPLDDLVDVRRRQLVQHLGDRPAQRLGPLPVPPGVRDHQRVRVARRPDPHREPAGPGLVRDRRGPAGPAPAPRTAAGTLSPAPPAARSCSPIRFANRFALSVGTSASPLMSRVSLIVALGKYRFGPSRTRSSTRDVTVGTLAERLVRRGSAVRECWFRRGGGG